MAKSVVEIITKLSIVTKANWSTFSIPSQQDSYIVDTRPPISCPPSILLSKSRYWLSPERGSFPGSMLMSSEASHHRSSLPPPVALVAPWPQVYRLCTCTLGLRQLHVNILSMHEDAFVCCSEQLVERLNCLVCLCKKSCFVHCVLLVCMFGSSNLTFQWYLQALMLKHLLRWVLLCFAP